MLRSTENDASTMTSMRRTRHQITGGCIDPEFSPPLPRVLAVLCTNGTVGIVYWDEEPMNAAEEGNIIATASFDALSAPSH